MCFSKALIYYAQHLKFRCNQAPCLPVRVVMKEVKPDFSCICCSCCRDTYSITCSCNILGKINLYIDLAYESTPHHKVHPQTAEPKVLQLLFLDLCFIDWIIIKCQSQQSPCRECRELLVSDSDHLIQGAY